MNTFLNRFFNEKNLDARVYEVTSANGTTNHIPSEIVIEAVKATRGQEAKQIESIIRKIDIHNGDVHHFLNHLAGAMAIDQS